MKFQDRRITMLVLIGVLSLSIFNSYCSASDLRVARDIKDVVELLSNAKELKVFGDMVPGSWNKGKYVEYVQVPLTVDSPETIQAIAKLIRDSNFIYKPLSLIGRTVKIGTKQHFKIEVDNKAYIYILGSDMIICQDHRMYVTKRYRENDNTYFTEQVALLLKAFVDQKKQRDSQ